MVPLLSLGVPGNSTSSLFLGALTIQGLRTGPSLFRDTPEMAYLIILGFLLANVVMLPLSMFYCNFLATAVLRLKREILSGVVLTLCVTGAFAVSNNIFNIYIMIFFGFIGYTFNKYKIPQSPLILASILGSMMESNWTQSMVYADGSLSVFVTRPLSCVLLILSVIFIGMPLVKRFKKTEKAA
jgi:putative tricarboxylic transport membrane protein